MLVARRLNPLEASTATRRVAAVGRKECGTNRELSARHSPRFLSIPPSSSPLDHHTFLSDASLPSPILCNLHMHNAQHDSYAFLVCPCLLVPSPCTILVVEDSSCALSSPNQQTTSNDYQAKFLSKTVTSALQVLSRIQLSAHRISVWSTVGNRWLVGSYDRTTVISRIFRRCHQIRF